MAIKANNKPLREFDGTVYLPFGTEYSILLKNLNSVRARVTVFIDGEDVLDGSKIIVDANSEVDLKRFIRNGNYTQGNSFKFIEKTEKISKHRGDRVEDGLVSIQFEFERKNTNLGHYPAPLLKPHKSTPWSPYVPRWDDKTFLNNTFSATNQLSTQSVVRGTSSEQYTGTVSTQATTSGVTAPGSVNNQSFSPVYHFNGDSQLHTMTLELKGKSPNEDTKVTAPIVVKKSVRCVMCGTRVKQTAKFCHECGSSVDIR